MSNRQLELILRAKADTKDLEKLGNEIGDLVAALKRSGAAFDAAATDTRDLGRAYQELSKEEQKQIQLSSQTAAAVERAAAAKSRAAQAAASAVAAESRATQTAAVAEEKLAQERNKTYQVMARTEKAELDVAKAREQLRVATVRAEQAEKKAAETKKSYGLATDIVRKQIAAFVSGAALVQAGRQMLDFGRDALAAASDVEEGAAKFEQVFRDLATGVEGDLQKMAETNRRSIYDLKDYASELQNTFVPLGFAREQAAQLSQTITQLGIDIAAFSNKADADVIHNLTSAIVGNHEAVRSYGIVLTQTVINQELARMGAEELTGAALETAKAQARLNIIMRASADAQGAAVREADSYANTLKAWDAAVLDLKVSLGEGLLPMMTELVEIAIQAAEVLQEGEKFRAPIAEMEQSAESVEEIVAVIRESKKSLDDLDFWEWIEVNFWSLASLDNAERQIIRVSELAKDAAEFHRIVSSEFSRSEITTVADSLGLDPSWDIEEVTAGIYALANAQRRQAQDAADAAEMSEAYARAQEKILNTDASQVVFATATAFGKAGMEAELAGDRGYTALQKWGKELVAVKNATIEARDAQIEWNKAFGDLFLDAPVDPLIQAERDLADATGEWGTAHIDNSAKIAAIQAELAGDLTSEQKKALQDQLKDLDEFSVEYLDIVRRMGQDLSDTERIDLLDEMAVLQGQQGQTVSTYSGDIEAANEAKVAIAEANAAILQSYYDRAYGSIAARLIEEGNFAQLADVAVALGIMTQEEANLRMEYAQTVAALDELTATTEFYGLTAEQQAGAVKSLAQGIYDTADAALKAQENLKATQDFFATAPDSTAIGDYYRGLANTAAPDEGITTTVSVLIDPASSAEFTTFRGELDEYDANIYETEITAGYATTLDDFDSWHSTLDEYDRDEFETDVRADYGTTKDDLYEIEDQLDALTRNKWRIVLEYETRGQPPKAPGVPGAPGGGGNELTGGRGNSAGNYVDLTVNNYGGGDVSRAVKTGVLSALRSLG